MRRDSLPAVDPAAFPSGFERRGATTRGVLLAAGTSSRYGDENKLLVALDGEPLVRRAAATLVESDVDGVTVVVGHEAEAVREALADLDVAVAANPDYAAGQSTSVRRGVRDARERGADAVLIALGDMPNVAPASVDLVVEAYERGVADVVAAGYDGRRGNPVLFDTRHFDDLVGVDGDAGGRHLLRESESAVAVETGDPGVLRDVDRPGDLADVD